jgi:hypothetical protein
MRDIRFQRVKQASASNSGMSPFDGGRRVLRELPFAAAVG